MRYPLVFVGKHPCDDLPYIHGTVPDPRSGHPAFTFDGPDYSGYYIRLPRWLGRRIWKWWDEAAPAASPSAHVDVFDAWCPDCDAGWDRLHEMWGCPDEA